MRATDSLPLIKPMLAVPAAPFKHPDYLFEIKWDGYRCLAYLEDRGTTLMSRNLKDITLYFPDLGDMHRLVKEIPVILDGEIIVLREGQPSFAALQSRAKLTRGERVKRAADTMPALYVAFDILHRPDKPLVDIPLSERLEMLRKVLEPNRKMIVSEGVRGEGLAFFQACVDRGLEGAVAKRVDGRYLPGTRSPLWKKVRATREADLVICGYRSGKGDRLLGSLVLGAWDGKNYVYQGLVGTGMDRKDEKTLLEKLATIVANDGLPHVHGDLAGRNVQWVLPVLVCRVEYLTLTGQGILRHPVYRGLRDDKKPEECRPASEQNQAVMNDTSY